MYIFKKLFVKCVLRVASSHRWPSAFVDDLQYCCSEHLSCWRHLVLGKGLMGVRSSLPDKRSFTLISSQLINPTWCLRINAHIISYLILSVIHSVTGLKSDSELLMCVFISTLVKVKWISMKNSSFCWCVLLYKRSSIPPLLLGGWGECDMCSYSWMYLLNIFLWQK